MKTFTVAGVSRLDGVLTARFANDVKRADVLVKNGHTDVALKMLPRAMTKEQATAYLLEMNFANSNTEVETALKLAPKTERVKRASVVKVTGAKVKKEKRLSVEEANAIIVSTMREVSEAEVLARLVHAEPKKRRTRKTQAEAV